MNNVVDTLLEIKLGEEDDFLKVRETLTRIGVASKNGNILYQSCHILHKQGKFYVVHFKEMFMLDGKPSNFTEDDIGRRNAIANLLSDWGLVTIVDPARSDSPRAGMNQIKIIAFRDKDQWELVQKYNIGKRKV